MHWVPQLNGLLLASLEGDPCTEIIINFHYIKIIAFNLELSFGKRMLFIKMYIFLFLKCVHLSFYDF